MPKHKTRTNPMWYARLRTGILCFLRAASQKSAIGYSLTAIRCMLFVVALTGVFLYTRVGMPEHAYAATSDSLNFQARLLSSTGNIVPDGTYNVEFKLYDSLAAGASAQGVCVGGGTDDCLWVETRTGANKVTVRSGYLSVHLGDVTSFPAINWDQNLYLTMNIGGTGAPSYDGEMTPRLKLTAVPYAFAAGQLAKYNGTQTGTLKFNTVANSPDILLPDIAGTNNVLLQSGTTLFTQGSIPFTDSNGRQTQDNANYFWDDSNNRLGIGTASPSATLSVGSGGTTNFTVTGATGTINTNGGYVQAGVVANTFTGVTTLSASGTALVVTNDATIGGTLGVSGLATFNAGLTVINGQQLTNAGSTLLTAIVISDLPTGGAIGTAAATVNSATTFNVNQTTSGQTLTLPNPTVTTAGRIAFVTNIGSTPFAMHGVTVTNAKAQSYVWNGSAWVGTNIDGAGSGATSVGTLDGAAKSADGASISANLLYLQTADATYPGLVSTGVQTLAGAKTFSAQITAGAGVDLAAQTLQGTTALINFSNFDVDASGNIITAGDLAVNGGDITSSGALNITPGGGLVVGATGQTATLQGSTTTITSTGTLNVGANATAQTITLGNVTGATALILYAGTGNFVLDGVAGTTYTLGASTTTGTVTIGGTAQTGATTVGSSSGTNSVLIGNGAGATTVDIANANTAGAVNIGSAFTTGTVSIGGTGAQTGTISLGTGTGVQTINLGTGVTGAKTVTLGSTASTGITTIQAGGNIVLNSSAGTIELQDNTNITGNLDVSGTIFAGTGDAFQVSTAGVVTYAAGATDTATQVCRNAAGQLAGCNSTGTGAAFVQGGNSFTATAILGTNDANDLQLETNGTTKLTVTSAGSVGIGTTSPLRTLDVNGSTRVTGTATYVLTGSIDPTASTAVVGVGTLFLTELVPGDTITVSGESRTVASITDNLNLTAGVAFSDNANDTSVDVKPAAFVIRDASNNVKFVVKDDGIVGIGTSAYPAGTLLNVGVGSPFSVNTTGAVTAVGVNSGSGLLQGTGGLTVTGATNINASGAGATIVGNASAGALAVQGSTVAVTSNGAGNDITVTSADQIILNSVGTIELQDSTNVTGDFAASGNADIAGTLFAGTGDAFQVSTAGAVTAVGVNSGTGLLQGTGGLTLTGAVNINASGAGAITIGNASAGALALQGSTLALTSNGAGNDITVTSADQIILNSVGTIELQDNTNITGNLDVSGTIFAGTGDAFQVSTAGVVNYVAGSTDTVTQVCRNAAGQLAGCSATGTGAAFIQGGNSFTATAVLGTNDANDLQLETNNSTKLTITSAGNVGIGTTGPIKTLDVNGSTRITASTSSNLTGSIDPTASTSVVGVGTLFLTELEVGDRIVVSGQTRTVATITDNLNLTVGSAFTDGANDTSPDRLPAALIVRSSAGAVSFIVQDSGAVSVGNTTIPASALFSVGTNGAFAVTAAGAVTATGVDSGTGLLQGTGGLTVTGATNINASGAGATTIGNASAGALSVQGSTATITSNGATNDITLTSADQIILNSTGTIELQDATNITGNLGVSGNADIAGTLFAGTGDAFQVSAAGAVTAVGVNSGTGLLQGTGGFTLTGTTLINTTGSGTTQIGNATGTFQLDSSALDVTTAGALSGITTISTSSTINSQTISSTANFTGTLAVQGANSLTLGTASTNTGSISFYGSGSANAITLTGPTSPGVGLTLTLPNETGTLCSTGSVCSGYAAATGGAGYIQNGISTQTSANFNIQSSAAGNVGGVIQGATSQTADLFQLKDSAGAKILGFDAASNLEMLGYINNASGGIGTYSNFVKFSEVLDDVSIWTATNITVTGDDAGSNPAPNSQTTADKLVSTAANGTLTQTYTTATTGNYTYSVWVKTNSGTATVNLRIDTTGGSPGTGTAASYTATTTWQRFSVTQNVSGQSAVIPTIILPNNATTVAAWGAQLVRGTTPQVYVQTFYSVVSPLNGAVSNGNLYVTGNTAGASLIVQNGATGTNAIEVKSDTGATVAYVTDAGGIVSTTTVTAPQVIGTTSITGGTATLSNNLLRFTQSGLSEEAVISTYAGLGFGGDLKLLTDNAYCDPSCGDNGGDITLQTGTGTTDGAGGTIYLTAGAGGSVSGLGGSISIQVGDAAVGSNDGSISIGTSYAPNGITVGSTTQTAAITLGQSTASNTINIGNANTANGATQTINIGAGTPAGTGKSVITIGNANGASQVNLVSGTGNVTLGSSTTGLQITPAGVLSDIDGATVNINDDLDVSGTLTVGTANATNLSLLGVLTLAGNQTRDITTLGAATSTGITIQPGTSTANSGTGASMTIKGGDQSGTTSTGGSINIDGGTGTSTNGAINIGTLQNSAINIATTGTNTSAISIGNSASGALAVQGSTVTLTSNGASNDIILNSADTIELQDNTNITGNLDVSGTLTSGNANALNVSVAGVITLAGGQSPADITTPTASTATSVTIQPGISSAATGNGANTFILGGNQSGTTTSAGGYVSIQGGGATGASGTRTGGAVVINGGTGAGGGANGTVGIGTLVTSAVNLGNGSGTFSLSTTNIDISSAGVISGATGLTVAGTTDINATGTAATTIGNSGAGVLALQGSTVGVTSNGAGNDITLTSADDILFQTGGANTRAIIDETGNLTFQQATTISAVTSGGATGYGITLQTGTVSSGTGGTLSLLSANGAGTGSGGAIAITAGNGSGVAAGGSIAVTSGNASFVGGSLSLTAGNATGGNGIAGNVAIQAGQATGSSGTRTGGSVSIDAGAGISVNGSITIGTSGSYVPASITVGNTAQTGALTLQSGTGNIDIGTSATARSINIGTGVAVVQTISIGGTGANVIAIGNTQTAGSISLGAAMTGGTISIGGTGLQTGNIDIGVGTGAQTVNIATGGTGIKTVNIGTGVAVANPINIGGTGANVIAIGNTQTAGSISLGAAMTGGTISIGGTGLQTGNIDIGVGTGAQAINLGTGGTGIKTIAIGGTAANVITLGSTQTAGSIDLGAAMIGGTINIGGTGLQTGTITLGGGTGAQIVNLATGGTGIKTINLGGTAANVIAIGNTQTAGSISLGAAMTGGTISIGGTGAQTGTISIATGTGVQTVDVGTGGTGAKTVNIGSTASTSSVTINTGSGVLGLNTGTARFTEITGTRTLTVETRTTNVAGTSLTVSAGAAGIGASPFTGGLLSLLGGAAGGTGNANGGNVALSGGAGTGTGVKGLVVIDTPTYATATVQNFTGNAAITQANVDANGAILISSDAAGYTATMGDPTITTAGRIVYVTNSGSFDMTLSVNGGGSGNTITLKPNTSATMIWNGADWTAAGASSSTDLQAAYNNTATSAGGAELVLNASGGAADGLTIRNNDVTPINGGILEVQSSIGTNLFSVNNFGTELAANGGSETSSTWATNWTAAPGGGSPVRTTTAGEYVTGQAAVEVVTAGTSDGVKNNLSGSPVISTTYQVSFTAKLSAGTFTGLEVVYSDDGTDEDACTAYSTQTLSTSVWTKITCTITTDAGGVSGSGPDLIIRQPSGDATARTFWIDNLSFMRNDATTQPSNVQIGGGINGGPVTLFTLDRSSAPPVASGDTTYLGSMYYDTVTGRIQCYESDGWGACGSAPDNIITLTPEYSGAVLNGSGVGTMTADFCSNETAVLVVGTLCANHEVRNFYRWTSPQASAQTYSIYVSYKLPSTFREFNSSSTMKLTALTTDTTLANATFQVFRKNVAGNVITSCGSATTINASNDTWEQTSFGGDETACGFTGSDYIVFKINVTAEDNENIYIENLDFTYSNR